jgi:hypothetical protein
LSAYVSATTSDTAAGRVLRGPRAPWPPPYEGGASRPYARGERTGLGTGG